MNESNIKTHLQYEWWAYLLIAVAVIAIWLSVFAKFAEPAPNEMLNITVVGTIDEKGMQDGLFAELKGKTNKQLKEVNIETIAKNNAMLGELLAMRCVGDTDFIIFEEDAIYDNMGDLFYPVDKELFSEYVPNAKYLEQNGETLGILLNGENTLNRFTNFYKGEKKCWLFITPASKNVAAMNGKGEKADNSALLAIQYLLEEV